MLKRRKMVYEIATVFSFIVGICISILTFVISKIKVESLRTSAREYAIAVADGIKGNIASKITDLETSYDTAVNLLNDPSISTEQKIDYLRMFIFSQGLGYIAVYDKGGKLLDAISEKNLQIPEEIPAKEELSDDKLYFDVYSRGGDSSETILYGAGKLILNNQPAGYIAIGIKLEWLSELVRNVSYRRFGMHDFIFILDQNGRILAHPEPAFVGKTISDIEPQSSFDFHTVAKRDLSLSNEQVDYENRKVFRTYISFPKFHWIISVSQLSDSIYSELRKLYITSFLVGLSFIAFAISLAVLSSRYLARPIEKLKEGINKVAEKDFGIKVRINSRNEIGELAESFNYMVDKINEYREEIKKETEMRVYLQRYVPTYLVTKIEEDKLGKILGKPEFRELSIMFADIVDFTASTQKLGCEKVALLLNRFFSLATECVFKYDGVVDKFIGDCIMALFGVFDDQKFAEKSVLSAIEIVNVLRSKKDEFEREIGIGINVRIGIATGRALVGSIGSDMRADYTAIGEAVNLASRLQELAPAGEILIESNTKEKISNKDMKFSFFGSVTIRGISEAVEVYKVIT